MVSRLSKESTCPDCLVSPQSDKETCWFSVPIQLVNPSARSINLRASTTVKLSFSLKSTFYTRLDEHVLRSKLNITVQGLKSEDYISIIRFEQGEILIDLYFKETKKGVSTIIAEPVDLIILRNSKSGEADLIFWKQSGQYEIQVHKAPDSDILDSLGGGL